jgi:hypothetical protein
MGLGSVHKIRMSGWGFSDLLQTLGICTVFWRYERGRGVKNLEKLRTYFVRAPSTGLLLMMPIKNFTFLYPIAISFF